MARARRRPAASRRARPSRRPATPWTTSSGPRARGDPMYSTAAEATREPHGASRDPCTRSWQLPSDSREFGRAARLGDVSGGHSSRTRATSERSSSSTRSTPRPRRPRRQCAVDVEHQREQRGLLGGAQVASLGLERALLQHALAQQPRGDQRDRARGPAGSHADQLGDRPEPVGLERAARALAAARAPAGSAAASAKAATASASREEESVQLDGRVVARVGELAIERPHAPHERAACAP